MTITADIAALSPSALIELFELDATALGGDLLRFHAGTNSLMGNITWNGNIYTAFPIQATGFDYTGTGQIPRPKLVVANLAGAITAYILGYADLLGAKVTRRRTLAKYLDAVNFPGGVNPTADPTAELPADIWFVDRKSAENKNIVEFELSAAFDVAGVQLPRRQIIQNLCGWRYRGAECGFTGAPVFDSNDRVISSASTTQGQAVLAAYNAVTSAKLDLANAEITLSAASASQQVACGYQKQSSNYSTTKGHEYYVLTVGDTTSAKFDGAVVTLGLIYRKGDPQGLVILGIAQSAIEVWGLNPSACAIATPIYNAALTARDAAKTALATARTTLLAAVAALPLNDPLYLQDKCPKRLASCRVRFGNEIDVGTEAELPYGGFPAAGLIR